MTTHQAIALHSLKPTTNAVECDEKVDKSANQQHQARLEQKTPCRNRYSGERGVGGHDSTRVRQSKKLNLRLNRLGYSRFFGMTSIFSSSS